MEIKIICFCMCTYINVINIYNGQRDIILKKKKNKKKEITCIYYI